MARKYEAWVEEREAVEFTVQVTEDYMNAWLIICNNVRVYHEDFLKVNNCSDDRIFVISTPESRKEARNFLKQFGEITREADIIAAVVMVERDYDDFDKDWVESELVLDDHD